MPAVVHRLGEERDQLIVRAVVSLKGGGGGSRKLTRVDLIEYDESVIHLD